MYVSQSLLGENAQLQQMNNESQFDVLDVSVKLFHLLNENPKLLQNSANRKNLTDLSEKIFARKENLNSQLQMAITKLFYALHGLRSTAIQTYDGTLSVSSFVAQYPQASSLLVELQTYPISLKFLRDERLSCGQYFKDLTLELNDGEKVTLSQGFLAHFSEMVQAKIAHATMSPDDILILQQLDRNQCDVLVAYLETESKNLIYESNIFALMEAALYLQIPLLLTACKNYLITQIDRIDYIAMPELLNVLDDASDSTLISLLENKISLLFSRELAREPLDKGFKDILEDFRKRLQKPISLTCCESSLKDHQLALLKDTPIKSLRLTSCPQLTGEALKIIASWPSLKELALADNRWVDDHVCQFMPQKLSALALIALPHLSVNGLRSVNKSELQHLTIQGCGKLTDEDFSAILPETLVSLDLRQCRTLGEKTIQTIAAMRNLTRLVLAGVALTPAWVGMMPKGLEVLDLAGCSMDDAACQSLAKMTKLKRLNLNKAVITDAGLALLPASIQWLSLCDCKGLGNRGVAALRHRDQLREIELLGHLNVIPQAVEVLLKASKAVHWQGSKAGNPAYWE